ncbi:hypothetical protein C8J55DRAFT_485985 [Lentinula edodes]|uniref:Uncharacterized protein n=1 Tax=Lentinula lateritia TaxID=40482 RepID=A0A9W9AWN4_9AGAR|nr:hypothetical protein C8J55DRAFT_485985 [Lentinula edodes]
MPSGSTVIIRCDQTNPLYILEDAFPDPFLCAFVQTHLGEAFRIECITGKHIIQLDNGLYMLTPDYARKLWLKLGNLKSLQWLWLQQKEFIQTSKRGLGLEVNWGEYFGMTQEEFFIRVSWGTMQFGHSSLINKLTGDYKQDLALILHPTHSSTALTWFLDPYNPTNFLINGFIPKAYITEEEEDNDVIANFIAESL